MQKLIKSFILITSFLGLLGSISVAEAWHGYDCEKFHFGSVEYKSCQGGYYGHHYWRHSYWAPPPAPGYYYPRVHCYTHYSYWGPVRRCVPYY